MRRLAIASLLLSLAAASACTYVPGTCPVDPSPLVAHPASVVGGSARAPLAWQNTGATDALSRESALAGAQAWAADAAGNALPGLSYQTTGTGAFDVRRLAAGYEVQIIVRKTMADGRVVTLRTLAQTASAGVTVDVDVASTILTLALLEGRTGLPGMVDAAVFAQAVALVYQHLSDGTRLEPGDDAAMIAKFKTWLAADAVLKALFDQLAGKVAVPSGSLDELIALMKQLSGQTAPNGLPPFASASPMSPMPLSGASASPGASDAASPEPSPTPTPITGSGTVITFAGGNGTGDHDDVGTAATFNNIMGLAVDAGGTLYVSEGQGHRVRMVSADGTVTTLAGSDATGHTDAAGSAASFGTLGGICVGSGGVVYVADTSNQMIRAVDVGGNVTTVAGSGAQGSSNGPAKNASFNGPTQVVQDTNNGNLYIIEGERSDIRVLTIDNQVEGVAGTPGVTGFRDGAGSNALFWSLGQAVVEGSGKLVVTDSVNCMIRRVDPAAANKDVSTVSGKQPDSTGGTPGGGYAEGGALSAQFKRPTGIALAPDGSFVVSDTNNQRIRRLSADGTTTLVAGTDNAGSDNGTLDVATFTLPGPIAVAPDGTIYVVDGNGGTRIRKITPP